MTILMDYQENPAGLRACLQSETVSGVLLAEFQFATDPLYACNAQVPVTVGGNLFQGLGDLVSVATVQGGPKNLTPVMRYGLGLPSELLPDAYGEGLGNIAAIMSNAAEYADRLAILSLQVMKDGAPYGQPMVLHTGRMSRPRIEVKPGEPLRFSVMSESVLVRKRVPPSGFLTDKDQQTRHPGDKGLGFVINATTESVDWLND